MNARIRRNGRTAMLALLLLSATTSTHADEWIALAPGIVGSADREQFFAAGPAGEITRVVVENGARRTIGAERGFPLALVDGQLLVLGVPTQAGEARLALIDADSGAAATRVAVALPAEVAANPLPLPKRTFRARAVGDAANLRIDWTFEQRALRGAVLHDADGVGSLVAPDLIELSGAFVVTVSGRALAVRFARGNEPTPTVPSVDLVGAERLSSVTGAQFRSADENAVLNPVAETHPAFGTVWRWNLHDRGTAETLGALTVPYALAPFIVTGGVIVYRIDPVMRLRDDGSREEHGARLIAFDLAAGRERWSVPVVEREWFGPLPP